MAVHRSVLEKEKKLELKKVKRKYKLARKAKSEWQQKEGIFWCNKLVGSIQGILDLTEIPMTIKFLNRKVAHRKVAHL